jgi:tetratricopeptide (TPR) repeat protein
MKMHLLFAAVAASVAIGSVCQAMDSIQTVFYENDPAELKTAKKHLLDEDLANQQRTLAKLGKAKGLCAAKKHEEAISLVEEILKTADPENVQVMARAYNVLGTAQRQAGRTKEALLAFLHVDLLYPSLPDAHAEALANLADLWEQVHKPERATQARKTLEEEYKDSPWAKKNAKVE